MSKVREQESWFVVTLEIIQSVAMFGIFKKKSPKEKLYAQYKKLMQEAHALSTSNRSLSDQKTAEANEVMKQIEAIRRPPKGQ